MMTVEKMRWNPTVHAVKRIKERCGIDETQAKAFVNQLMASAKYVTTNKNGTITYKHDKRDIMIVVNAEDNIVITLHSATQTADGAPVDVKITVPAIKDAILRQYKRMTTELKREVRKLHEQAAEIHVQAAQLNVNKIRCKAPHTQALIQSRIDGLLTQAADITRDIDAKLTQIETAGREVKAVVGE